MLPRKNKITRAEFDKVFKSGRTYNSPLFTARIAYINNTNAKFSCVVSKKVSKGSPNRHTIKRRVYSAIQKYILKLQPGTNCIIIMRPSLNIPTFDALDDSLKRIFKESKSLMQ